MYSWFTVGSTLQLVYSCCTVSVQLVYSWFTMSVGSVLYCAVQSSAVQSTALYYVYCTMCTLLGVQCSAEQCTMFCTLYTSVQSFSLLVYSCTLYPVLQTLHYNVYSEQNSGHLKVSLRVMF